MRTSFAPSNPEREQPLRGPTSLRRFLAALRAFLHGFVGHTALPHDCAAARHALDRQASGRGRCC